MTEFRFVSVSAASMCIRREAMCAAALECECERIEKVFQFIY